MAKLNLSPESQNDLHDIKDYITTELASPTAASNIVSNIMKAIRNLAVFPACGAPLSSIVDIETDYRFLVSGNYLAFYRYENDNVYVVRVLYGKRDYMRILFQETQTTPDTHNPTP